MESLRHAPPPEAEVHYTAFIRLPFARGDFVDPPQVQWIAAKDKALWRILSDNSRSMDLDWKALAGQFQVTLAFILQQAAWLYERQLLNVRAQMRKMNSPNTASPVPGTSQTMRRIGSSEGARVPSSLSYRPRDSSSKDEDTSVPTTPRMTAPPIHRNLSSSTVTQSRQYAPPTPESRSRTSVRHPSKTARNVPMIIPTATEEDKAAERSPSPARESSSSSSDSSADEMPARSQAFRRPGRPHQLHNAVRSPGAEDDDDDDEAPAFLPVSQSDESTRRGMVATIRGGHLPHDASRHAQPPASTEKHGTDSSTSSGSSSAPAAAQPRRTGMRPAAGPSSGRVAGDRVLDRNPREIGITRQSSEAASATSSKTSSSFSELDDASVTQSALEEALASNMQHGGTSRISTISQALKSRYM